MLVELFSKVLRRFTACFRRLGNGIALNQLLEGGAVIVPNWSACASGACLRYVVQHQTVEGAGGTVEFEQWSVRFKGYVAVNIAHCQASKDGVSFKIEVCIGIKSTLPLNVTRRVGQRCRSLGGVDIFDHHVVIPTGAGTSVVVTDNYCVVAECAVQAVNTDTV